MCAEDQYNIATTGLHMAMCCNGPFCQRDSFAGYQTLLSCFYGQQTSRR